MKRFATVALIILTFLQTACGGPGASQPSNMIEYGMFYKAGEKVTGGAPGEGVNIKSIDVARNAAKETEITISFVRGSKYSGIDEARLDSVPVFSAVLTGSPTRLAISFEAIEHWDWEYKKDEPQYSTNLLTGVFRQIPLGESPYTLYFQLAENVGYRVSEKDDTLKITLKPMGKTSAMRFYATVNAYDLFSEGKLTADLGLAPTLCSDKTKVLLISPGFEKREQAEAFCSEVAAKQDYIKASDFLIAQLGDNVLPDFAAAEGSLYQRPVLERSGVKSSLPVVMTGGRYLCSSPDGRIMLFSRPVENESGEEEAPAEELWIMENNGKLSKLGTPAFSSIMGASYSPDGRKLALIDSTEETSSLYVVELDLDNILNLGEEGFGTTATAFAWDSSSQKLYGISGDDTMRIREYDFTKPQGTRARILEKLEAPQGDMQYCDGLLYFSDQNAAGSGKIYAFDPLIGTRKPYAEGDSLKIAAGGKFMAIVTTTMGGEAEDAVVTNSLRVRDMATGAESTLLQVGDLQEYCWSISGDRLYYMVARKDAGGGADADFPYTLYSYDVTTKKTTEIGRTVITTFYPGNASSQLLMVDIYGDIDSPNSIVTYLLDTEKL